MWQRLVCFRGGRGGIKIHNFNQRFSERCFQIHQKIRSGFIRNWTGAFYLRYSYNVLIECNNTNISGSQWVFSVFELNCEQGFIDFCDKTTYHLAFWILIVYYALLTIIILLFIFFITTTWILSVIKTNKSWCVLNAFNVYEGHAAFNCL